MRARRLATVGLIVLVGGLVLAGCGGSDNKESTSDTTEATSSATSAAAGGASIDLTTKDFEFVPKTLTAKSGQAVTVTIKNDGQAEHNFSITSLNVNKDIEKGKTETVTFTPASAGTLDFFCEYHKDSKGMVGTITVT